MLHSLNGSTEGGLSSLGPLAAHEGCWLRCSYPLHDTLLLGLEQISKQSITDMVNFVNNYLQILAFPSKFKQLTEGTHDSLALNDYARGILRVVGHYRHPVLININVSDSGSLHLLGLPTR